MKSEKWKIGFLSPLPSSSVADHARGHDLSYTLFDLNRTSMQASAEQQFKGARAADETIARAYKFADLSSYPPKKRFLIRTADLAFFVLIKLIGRTIRWQVEGWENWEAATREGQVPIYTFWHNRVFLATYFWQKRRIVVMTSQSFDGEYIARFIQRFGYGAARGSSTRGAVGAMRCPADACRIADGLYYRRPERSTLRRQDGRSPAREKDRTAHSALYDQRATFWEAKRSWDGFQVPLPFSRACVQIAAPIYVSAETDDEALEAKRDELQAALDKINIAFLRGTANRAGASPPCQPRADHN